MGMVYCQSSSGQLPSFQNSITLKLQVSSVYISFSYLAAYCWVFSFTIPFLSAYILSPSPKEAHKPQASAMTGNSGQTVSFKAVDGLALVPGWTTDILLICLVFEPLAVTLFSLLQLLNCHN